MKLAPVYTQVSSYKGTQFVVSILIIIQVYTMSYIYLFIYRFFAVGDEVHTYSPAQTCQPITKVFESKLEQETWSQP